MCTMYIFHMVYPSPPEERVVRGEDCEFQVLQGKLASNTEAPMNNVQQLK